GFEQVADAQPATNVLAIGRRVHHDDAVGCAFAAPVTAEAGIDGGAGKARDGRVERLARPGQAFGGARVGVVVGLHGAQVKLPGSPQGDGRGQAATRVALRGFRYAAVAAVARGLSQTVPSIG